MNKENSHPLWTFVGRTFALIVGVLSLLTIGLIFVADASAATEYRIVGRGWGHGIGMSQYGAKGFAEKGATAQQIISHYYPNTNLGDSGDKTVNVLLAQGRGDLSFYVDGPGGSISSGGQSLAVQAQDTVLIQTNGTVTVTRPGVQDPLTLLPAADITLVGGPVFSTQFQSDNGTYGHHYRGNLLVNAQGAISVVNQVQLEDYLLSVVPAESPSSWPIEALKAQSIAARSYAIATAKGGSFDHYADVRSQMYTGMEREIESTTRAVNETRGKVAMHDGQIIAAFFFSTSGGKTAAVEDVWGSEPRAYLKSVQDPYEVSPYSRWSLTLSPQDFSQKLGQDLNGKLKDVKVHTNASTYVSKVDVVGSGGNSQMSASSFQVRFGLRSPWYRVEKLSLMANPAKVKKGQKSILKAAVPLTGKTVLQYKPLGSKTWSDIGPMKPNKAGAAQITLYNVVTGGMFRLVRDKTPGPAASVKVI